MGSLKMNKISLVQQIRAKWLVSEEGDKMRAALWDAAWAIRRSYRQAIWDINAGQFTGTTQTYADAVLRHCTPTGAPLDELLKDLGLNFLVGGLNTTQFTGQMWPQIAKEIRKINREKQ